MKLTTQAAGKTDIGLVRKNNEDNFGYDNRNGIFVVCDGMGGQAAGEVASKIAVDTVLGYFHQDEKSSGAEVMGRGFAEVSESANALANAIRMGDDAASLGEFRSRARPLWTSTRMGGRPCRSPPVSAPRLWQRRQLQPLSNSHQPEEGTRNPQGS